MNAIASTKDSGSIQFQARIPEIIDNTIVPTSNAHPAKLPSFMILYLKCCFIRYNRQKLG